MRVLGFMTGTSLDAVDMAVLETDGEATRGFGPAGERKLSSATRSIAAFDDPEIVYRLHKSHHAGLLVRSDTVTRVATLVADYRSRFERDFCTSMPAPDRPTS